MLNRRKKSIVELTSFSLLTLVIVVASLVAYAFSISQLKSNTENIDLKNMNSNLIKLSYVLNQIKTYDNSERTFFISFKTGNLKFENNQVLYYSLIPFVSNSTFCSNVICFNESNDYEVLFFNLSYPYTFSENFSLVPGDYVLSFKNNKNESKIETKLLQ